MAVEGVYFTRDEVVVHNSQDDMWVSANGLVYDLTDLVEKRLETMTDVSSLNTTWAVTVDTELSSMRLSWQSLSFPQSLRLLIQFAGKDLSWCFDDKGEPLERINQFGSSVPVFPPLMEKASDDSEFWWRDLSFVIGRITCMERRIRIMNTLTRKIICMAVCEEDSIETIQQKYSKRFNRNADSYIWRKSSPSDKVSGHLFMKKTLTQNGILFKKNEELGLPRALWLYFVLNKNWTLRDTLRWLSAISLSHRLSALPSKKQSNYNFSSSPTITIWIIQS